MAGLCPPTGLSTASPAPAAPATASAPLGRHVPDPSRVPPRSDPPRPPAVPVRLEIPRIGVDTELMELGLNADGTVMVPPTEPHAPAGWYRFLASPGEPGPAVILGHVDTYDGPGVFYRLHALHPSDSVVVRLADGRSAVFAVDSVHTYPKREFPSEAVYGTTAEPVLRLVTCGGTFDRARRTYLSNVVVFATLVSPRDAAPALAAAAVTQP